MECAAVHGLRPTEADIEAAFRKEPEGFLRSVVAGLFAIEEERHLAIGKLLGPASDLFDLMLGDAVGHDRDCWDAEVVEADHIVEAFYDEDAVTGNRLAVAGFFEAARLLAKEFESAMEAFWEPMLHRCGDFGPLGWREASEIAFLLLVGWIAADPREYLSVFGEDWIDDVASQTEAAFVIAAVQRQDAAAPLLHRLRRKAGMAANVARGGGRHGRDIDDELVVERGQIANFCVVGFDERNVSIRNRGRGFACGDLRRAVVWSRRHRRIAGEDVFHAMKLVPLELLTGGTCAGEPAVHQRQQVASKTTLIRMAHEDLLRILGVDGNLTPAAVVTLATERAIETNLLAAAVRVERDAALGRRLNE